MNVDNGVESKLGLGLALVPIVLTLGLLGIQLFHCEDSTPICPLDFWIASGKVPTLIYCGLEVLPFKNFLVAGMILFSIVSVLLGTAWGTKGTVGLTLVGIMLVVRKQPPIPTLVSFS